MQEVIFWVEKPSGSDVPGSSWSGFRAAIARAMLGDTSQKELSENVWQIYPSKSPFLLGTLLVESSNRKLQFRVFVVDSNLSWPPHSET